MLAKRPRVLFLPYVTHAPVYLSKKVFFRLASYSWRSYVTPPAQHRKLEH